MMLVEYMRTFAMASLDEPVTHKHSAVPLCGATRPDLGFSITL